MFVNKFYYNFHDVLYVELERRSSRHDRGGVGHYKALRSSSLQISRVLIKWVKSAAACVLN